MNNCQENKHKHTEERVSVRCKTSGLNGLGIGSSQSPQLNL